MPGRTYALWPQAIGLPSLQSIWKGEGMRPIQSAGTASASADGCAACRLPLHSPLPLWLMMAQAVRQHMCGSHTGNQLLTRVSPQHDSVLELMPCDMLAGMGPASTYLHGVVAAPWRQKRPQADRQYASDGHQEQRPLLQTPQHASVRDAPPCSANAG